MLTPEDGQIDLYHAGVELGDGIIEATFRNPYGASEGNWSSGFIFRDSDSGFHSVGVHSSGNWYHHLRLKGEDENDQIVNSEHSGEINTVANGRNHIRIIALGNHGWLFINGVFVTTIDLSGLTSSGDVFAVGGYFGDDGIAGRTTRFEDFTVRGLTREYGPRDDTIRHVLDDGLIDVHNTDVVIKDGIIEARFFNPYDASEGHWSSGFMFRNIKPGGFHAVLVEESRIWHHHLLEGEIESTEELDYGRTNAIDTTARGHNDIRIIALGDDGLLFINDRYISILDLSGRNESGWVSAVGAYFIGDCVVGRSTRFEDFTIWSAD